MNRHIPCALLLAASVPITTPTPAAEVTEQAFLPGEIWDVDAERILWRDEQRQIWTTDRVTDRDRLVYAPPPAAHDFANGMLAPGGALFTYRDDGEFGDHQFRLFQSQAGRLTNHGVVVNSSLARAGDLLLFNRFYSGPDVQRPGQPLVLRNLRTGDETTISWEAGNNGNDVTADGVVSYWTGEEWSGPGDSTSDYNIFRWEDGESTRITNDTFLWNVYPRTDGSQIVYMKRPSLGFGGETELTLFAPELGEVRLNRPGSGAFEDAYLVHEGWIAYAESGGGWRLNLRSPAGDTTTLFGGGGFISLKGLSPNGQVVFESGNALYLAGLDPRTGGAPFLDLVDPSIFDNPVTYDARYIEYRWLLFGGGRVLGVNSVYNVPAPSSLALLSIALASGGLFRCLKRRSRSWQLRLRRALIAAFALVPLSHASGAEISWLGGVDSSWQTAANWSPVVEGDPPMSVQRIPQEGDSVVVADATHGPLVQLSTDTPPLASLLVDGGMQLNNFVFQFNVHDPNLGSVTTVRGPGSQLVLRDALPSDEVPELATDRLDIEDGGNVLLDDALAVVRSQLTIAPGGRFGGVGQLQIGGTQLPPGMLDNNGVLSLADVQTTSPELTIEAFRTGVLDLDGTSETGALEVDDGRPGSASMQILSPLADAFNGAIRIGNEDHLWSSHNATFTNALVQFDPNTTTGVASLHAAPEHGRPQRLTVDGADTLFSVPEGRHGLMDGQVAFQQGRFDVDGTLTLAGDSTFSRDFHLDLNDARQLFIQDFITDGPNAVAGTTINQSVIDLDGDSESIQLHITAPFTLNVDALDDDGTNTFNGKITVDSYLEVNVPGGWEVDGEFIADDRELTGSPVTFDEAVVRVNGRGFRLFEMDAVFTENARVLIEGEIEFLRSNVVIQGGQWSATGSSRAPGSVEFSGNVTIDGPTIMNLRSVDLGNVGVGEGRLTIHRPLAISTDEVETGSFPVGSGETIEIGPEGQLRMVVRDADFVPWTINRSLVLHGREDGSFSEHLSGSDAVLVGGTTVSGASALLPRVEIKSGVILRLGATLRLDGGGTRLGTTNRIVDAEILGPGTLAASPRNRLAGTGIIETAVAFDETLSILAAEGGTLVVAGPIESIHTIAAVDGTLALEGPWNAGEAGGIMLQNGTIRAGDLPLGGELSVSPGMATLDAANLRFGPSSVSRLDGSLTIKGHATIDAGAAFEGAGELTLAGSAALADGANLGVNLINRGILYLGEEGEAAAVEIFTFRQDSIGTLEMDLAGSSAGQFDRLFSVESPNLGGQLRVSLLESFEPALGDSFTILESDSSILGQFDTLDLPPLPQGLNWDLQYEPQHVTLVTTGMLELLPGDYDANGRVDQRDLDFVLLNWGNPADQAPPEWTSNPPTGLIDQDELDPVLLNWGATAGGNDALPAAIPEPSSLLLTLAVLALWLFIGHRGRATLLLLILWANGVLTCSSPAADVTELAFLPGTIWDVDAERIQWSSLHCAPCLKLG